MPDSGPNTDHAINGDPVALSLRRSTHELRDGRAIMVTDGVGAHVGASLETASPSLIDRIRATAPDPPRIAMASSSARWLGLHAPGDGIVELEDPDEVLARHLAARGAASQWDPATMATGRAIPAHPRVAAAVRLAKLARLRPEVIVAPWSPAMPPGLLSVDAGTCLADAAPVQRIEHIASASVPLRAGMQTAFHLFRQVATGDEHVAVAVGDPATADGPVAVRLHSACLTGDLFGSLRCDCGDQLRGAVGEIVEEGCGVLLYLAQEGRGIGLANKLRAYALQDRGLDTVDADAALGFGEDERQYDIAAAILMSLGVRNVRLKTNNPRKVAALIERGIVVCGREPLLAPVNVHNRPYLRAKAVRSGHILGPEFLADPADQAEPADQR